MEIIAHIRSDYMEKFGIPRQSGLVKDGVQKIIFEKQYRGEEWTRGIEDFSHLWILWIFSENVGDKVGATVRPPRLGGNKRKGVFATRSPFRPNPIGLSCVRLLNKEVETDKGTVLTISGGDFMDGTPVLDIKPYLSYADAYPDAKSGFADSAPEHLEVEISDEMLFFIEKEKRQALIEVLAQDPRPSYQNDEERIYGFMFSGKNIRFQVIKNKIKVISVEDAQKNSIH